MNDSNSIAATMTQGYKSAVAARDIEAFLRLYDPSVHIYDAWGVWSYEGTAAWRVAIESWFAADPDDRLQVAFDEVNTRSSPSLSSLSAIVTYSMLSAQGEQKNSMRNRISWVIDTSGPHPRIVHEHTSVPVRFEDGKAILQRLEVSP